MGSFNPPAPAAQRAAPDVGLERAYKLRQDAIAKGDYEAYRIARAIKESIECEHVVKAAYLGNPDHPK